MSVSRKPDWLRAKLPAGPAYQATRAMAESNKLHTVCQSAQCPNIGECWSRGTATVMILGNICTRSCNFCAIQVLVPDFVGRLDQVDIVLEAKPDIFNHNLETVERLQRPVRVQARYDRSRSVLQHAKSRGFTTKTGIMLGLGETKEEIAQTLRDIASDKIDILTLGQYLQPTAEHWKIDRWVTPEEFRHWKEVALGLGIGVVESGPLVRSSYHADEQSAKYVGEEHLNVKPALAASV